MVKTLTDADLNALLVASVRHAAKMPGQPSVFPKFQTGTYDDMAGFARAFGVSPEQLRREFEAVKARYEGTDGWMKAPNGQPTRLNRDQWVMVRTPRFKAWFGDWEQAAAIAELTAGDPIELMGNEVAEFVEPLNMRALRDKAREYGAKHVVGQYRNQPSGLELEVRPHGIEEAIQHGSGPDKLKVFAAIPELLRTGQVIYDGVNPKNPRGRLVVISRLVDLDGKRYAVSAGLREDPNGRLFYDHELLDVSRVGGLSSQPGEGPKPRHPAPTPTRLNEYYRHFITQKVQASKVVDANGEPLVVYHGTMEDFTEFNTKAKAHLGKLDTKLGSHFARSPKISDTFAGGAYAVASDYSVNAYTPENSWYRDRSGQIRFDGLFGYRGGWNDPIVPYDPAEHGEFRNLAHEGRIVMLRPNGTVLPAFLNIKKPIDAMSQDKDAWDETEVEKAVAQAILPTNPGIFREHILPNVLDGDAVLAQLQAGQTPITQGKYSYPDIGAFVADYHAMNYVPAEVVKAALRDAGFDGVIYNNTSKQEINNTDQSQRQSYIIFEPEQAKSATGNTGAFDPDNPDIRYKRPQDDRLARARSMGFDTSQVWYHGTPVGNDIRAFDLGHVGATTGTREQAIFLTDNPDVAGAYGYQEHIQMAGDSVTSEESYGALYPVYIRGRLYDATAEVEGKRYNSKVFQAITEKAKAAGYAGVDFGRNLGGPMERYRLSRLECVPAQNPRKAVLPTTS